jgi:hypothetical protein
MPAKNMYPSLAMTYLCSLGVTRLKKVKEVLKYLKVQKYLTLGTKVSNELNKQGPGGVKGRKAMHCALLSRFTPILCVHSGTSQRIS